MATKEIVLKPGDVLPEPLQNAFATVFGPDAVASARERGGKFRLVLTTPWPEPIRPKREKKIIDQAFVDRLKAMATDEAKLEAEVNGLNGPEILKVASLLHVPMSKSSKVPSLRAQLQKTLRSEIVWKSIAGQSDPIDHGQQTGSTDDHNNT